MKNIEFYKNRIALQEEENQIWRHFMNFAILEIGKAFEDGEINIYGEAELLRAVMADFSDARSWDENLIPEGPFESVMGENELAILNKIKADFQLAEKLAEIETKKEANRKG